MGQMALRSAFHASNSDVEICSAHLRFVAIKKPHVHTRTSGLENPELRTRSRPGNKLIFLSPETSTKARCSWDASKQPARLTSQVFSQKIQPLLANVPTSAIRCRIGVSRWYAGRILHGYRPHQRRYTRDRHVSHCATPNPGIR